LNPDSIVSVNPDPGFRAAPQKEQVCLRVVKKLYGYLGVKVRTRRVSPGVGGADPWLEQAGQRLINKLYLGVKVRTRRVSPGVGRPAPEKEQACLRVVKKSCTLERVLVLAGRTHGWSRLFKLQRLIKKLYLGVKVQMFRMSPGISNRPHGWSRLVKG
jgi:hypothetical protein